MANFFKIGLIIFIICGFFTGSTNDMFVSLVQTPVDVFSLLKTLVLSACLWNGILNMMRASGFMNHISKIMKPLLRWIYGGVVEDNDTYLYLSSNFIANLMGLGSLATMSGLKAMKILQKYQKDKHKPCKEMMILVVMNTTGLSLIPTTMITLRQSYQSQNILGFFKYTIVIGVICTLLGVFINKVMDRG